MERYSLTLLAGYFLARGCVSFTGPNNRLYIRIDSGDKEVLEMFYSNFGGSFGPSAKVNRQVYYWAIGGAKAKAFLLQISEFMVGPKRNIVSLALNYPCGLQNHKLPEKDLMLRQTLKTEIQAINQRADATL